MNPKKEMPPLQQPRQEQQRRHFLAQSRLLRLKPLLQLSSQLLEQAQLDGAPLRACERRRVLLDTSHACGHSRLQERRLLSRRQLLLS